MDTLKQAGLASLPATLLSALVVMIVATATVLAQSDGAVPEFDECDEIGVEYDENNGEVLTRSEKLEKMDLAFRTSLGRFERCIGSSPFSQSSASGDDGGGQGGINSVPSETISGVSGQNQNDNTSTNALEGGVAKSTDSDEAETYETPGSAPDEDEQYAAASSGADPNSERVPDNIPPPENDSILQAQIREAAMAEEDPVVRAKLWEEYHKYKK